MYRVKLWVRDKRIRLLPDERRLRNLGLIFIISASSISDEPAMEFQDVVGDEYSGGISCSSFLRAFRFSSTVKVSDFGKRARWRADGVDMLLLSDGMEGYLSPCSRETHPFIFRSPVKGMEGILTNQLM
ncbi:hypothetical protein F2Q70_00025304 [Brassica cretica]|uniref:Uncharacterized protein n=1 Tax=Brassica cretica TaxID=69181 RepID=A0A8S9LIZ9_BRACR|nr:hypothetical protein F2Q70_00025304 [Brassica cretica]